jgi:hypothetical protein
MKLMDKAQQIETTGMSLVGDIAGLLDEGEKPRKLCVGNRDD